jgi:hypothetical protein
MTQATPRSKRVELLLNTLVDERFVRHAFVSELVDELDGAAGAAGHEAVARLSEALRAARLLREQLTSGIADTEYKRAIARLIELTRGTAQRDDGC